MKFNKINIIGASGFGKTTLAIELSKKLGCVHFDSDDYYHFPTDPPFKKQRAPEERLNLLMTDLNRHSSWVLSGGAGVWVPKPLIEWSLVVFLYLPKDLRLERVRQREQRLYGHRIQYGGDMHTDHIEFMKWTAGYDDGTAEGTNTLAHHQAFLKMLSCPVVKLDSPLTTERQIETVLQNIS